MLTVFRSHSFRVCALTLLLAALVIVPAAAQDSAMSDTLRISAVSGAMQDTMKQIVDAYQKANPDVTVTLEVEPDSGTFEALIAAGNQPDLVITSFGPELGSLAAADAAVPLEDLPGAADLLGRIEQRALQNLYGHTYYIPVGADVTLMIYNKQLFSEAGLDPETPPQTWDEFLTAAAAIQALPARDTGDTVYGTVFWNDALQWGGWYWNMLQPIYLNGNQDSCQLLNALGTDIIFDRDQCKLAEFFTFVQKAQQFAPPTMEKAFFSRDIGMWLQYGYSWEPNLKEADGTPMVIGEDVGVAPVPVPAAGDQSYTTFGGRAGMILKTSPDHEARAWDFLKFMMQDDNNLTFLQQLGYLPVLTSLQSDAYFQDATRKPFIDLLQNGVVPEQYATAEKAAVALQGVYQNVVVDGSVPVADAVANAAQAARDALKASS